MWTAQIRDDRVLVLRAVLTTDRELQDYVATLRSLMPLMPGWANYADALDVIHGRVSADKPKV